MTNTNTAGDASLTLDVEGFQHRTLELGRIRLHAVEAGKKEGQLVVLLHGFPEFWWSWRHQIKALAEAGFYVVAPDMRGYNLSECPDGVEAYRVQELTLDVKALIHHLGREKAIVVGHDWGAVVAWEFAMAHPEMTQRLGILNVPHPLAMAKGLRTLKQLKKSWYIFAFQIPLLGETLIPRNDYEVLRGMFRSFPKEDADRYVEAAKRTGLKGPLNYYRAAARATITRSTPKLKVIACDVLVIWGENDIALGKELATPSPKWVPHARVEFLPTASHWVQNDEPARVNELLVSFCREQN